MPKAYWINVYREIKDPAKLQAYAQLAGPAIESNGGRFMVRGTPQKAYESGQMERAVVIEFESIDAAVKAHDSDAYQAALRALGDGAVRDIRFVEGVS